MNILNLPNVQIFTGRVSQVTPHCDAGVIPRSDAESSIHKATRRASIFPGVFRNRGLVYSQCVSRLPAGSRVGARDDVGVPCASCGGAVAAPLFFPDFSPLHLPAFSLPSSAFSSPSSRAPARNDGMRDTPLIENVICQIADIHIVIILSPPLTSAQQSHTALSQARFARRSQRYGCRAGG